ncbi:MULTISPECIES: hypothetical protein [Nonomuraea]|uniref:Uncharacterized protein n=1 Tax=Nonomuraea africana TaxID=46171 RepID=A0ABR9KXR9_9ACTN|nr:hypothetical protein [Nonomuraea africana]MBE1566565.1 hypothetical protein [Nonomuraea africana]
MAEPEQSEQQVWLVGQVADTRRIAELGFTETKGQLALILQRMEQGERRHDELASVVAENYRVVSERLDEHARGIQAAAEDRAAERSRIQTMGDSAKRFSTWMAIGVSALFGVLGIALKMWA